MFTAQFDHWSPEHWRQRVYNDGYGAVDPDYVTGARARANFPNVLSIAKAFGANHVLDYGGGDGALAGLLCDAGMTAVSFDPLRDEPCIWGRGFGLVTAFEVFEHTPTPRETAARALSFLPETTLPAGLLFSTLTCDDLPARSTDWWYLAPRNGHISLHTSESLKRLFEPLGFRVQHLSAGLHFAARA